MHFNVCQGTSVVFSGRAICGKIFLDLYLHFSDKNAYMFENIKDCFTIEKKFYNIIKNDKNVCHLISSIKIYINRI